jgi:hypothetical protein
MKMNANVRQLVSELANLGLTGRLHCFADGIPTDEKLGYVGFVPADGVLCPSGWWYVVGFDRHGIRRRQEILLGDLT